MTDVQPSKIKQLGMGLLLSCVALLLTLVVLAPIALSSGDLLRWAAALTGLGLPGWWPWLVFIALDAAAGVCVLLAVYCAWKGKGSGAFGLLVWVFAGFSAVANYRHGIVPGAPGDAWWFFPLMSMLGPGLLEAVTWFVRREVQRQTGSRARERIRFGVVRWLPVVGAPRDTYGARRTAMILGLTTVDEAVATYHALCPDGSLKVVKAIRARDVQSVARASRQAVARPGPGAGDHPTNLPVQATTAAPSGSTVRRAAAATARPSTVSVRAAVEMNHASQDTTRHGPTAVLDAATIRDLYPDGLPEVGAQRKLRNELGWHPGKATNALRALRAGADLTTPTGADSGAQGSESVAAPLREITQP